MDTPLARITTSSESADMADKASKVPISAVMGKISYSLLGVVKKMYLLASHRL